MLKDGAEVDHRLMNYLRAVDKLDREMLVTVCHQVTIDSRSILISGPKESPGLSAGPEIRLLGLCARPSCDSLSGPGGGSWVTAIHWTCACTSPTLSMQGLLPGISPEL